MELINMSSISLNDFNTICRVCLVARSNMVSISTAQILHMLEECTSVHDDCDGKLPQQICKNCFWQLKNAYHFKQQCTVSMDILRNILNNDENVDNKPESQNDNILSAVKVEVIDALGDFVNEKLNTTTNSDVNENLEVKNESSNYTFNSDLNEYTNSKNSDYDDLKNSLNNDDYLDDEDDDDSSSLSNDDCKDENINEEGLEDDEKTTPTEEKTQTREQKQKSVADLLIKKYNIYGLTCNICHKDLSNRFSMLRHMEVHDQNRSLKYHCKTCNKGFYAAENLKKHEIRHLGKTKYQCDKCPKRFYVLSALGVHCKSSHKAKPISCSQCSQQFYHQLQVEQHLQTHEEKKFVCEDCGKIFPTRNRLTKHKKIHSEERPYKCNMCESAFKQKFNLTIHMKLRHLETDRREMCNVCGKLFHPGSLRAHLETHNTDTIYKCQECGKIYANRIILGKHINQKHKNGGTSKKYYCNICNKALGSSGSLRKHMVVMHTTLEKSECHICGKMYKSQNGVKVHILSAHMDERPHICQTCNKAFHSKNVLEKHMRTHTGERPFPCNVCGKAFGFKQVLKTHMKIHTK